MPKESFKYSNNDITVVWRPQRCIHSTLCWKGLLNVFDPRDRPWIRMDGATTEQIIHQVEQCPSGALSYFRNDLAPNEPVKKEQDAEGNLVTKVEVTSNG